MSSTTACGAIELAGATGGAHVEQQRDEPWLDTVVQVAFDLAPGRVAGVDQASTRRAQLGHLGGSRSERRLCARLAACGRDEGAEEQQAPQADDGTNQRSSPSESS